MIIDNITYQLAKSDFFLNKLDNIKKKKKIISVTGIKKLYKVRNNEDIISLAISSLKKVKSKIQDSDAIIFVTQTPKLTFPQIHF